MTQTPTAPKNSHLGAAKAAKNDEFYTQWPDIECEMNAYLEYDPDVFRGRVILLPCDDPESHEGDASHRLRRMRWVSF